MRMTTITMTAIRAPILRVYVRIGVYRLPPATGGQYFVC